jgi:5S rRNA maturation endonuclease (ribonuclease M5)
MNFSELAKRGIEKIYSEDLESQENFLKVLMSEVREMDNYEILLKAKAFFVPNPEYMLKYFGDEARHQDFDMYAYDGACLWDNFVVFPIENVSGRIAGFVGFDPINKLKKKHGEEIMDANYRYTNKTIFNRGRYIYTHPGIYKKAIEEEYIILVDGVYDMHNLVHWGFNAASMLGSSISPEILFQLKFIKHIFVAEDNDKAGRELYTGLAKVLPNVHYVRQGFNKDADDVLKGSVRDRYIQQLWKAINMKASFTLKGKPLFKVM